jgi:hypothetical protein
VDVLIAGGTGSGLQARLARKGIEAVVTPEKEPDRAVSLWLAHSLARAESHSHAQGAGHGLDHDAALLLASRPGPTFLRSSAICRKLPGSGTCAPSSAASSVADDDQGEPQ